MEMGSMLVQLGVLRGSNALHYGTNPFSLVDIEREINEFLEFARSKYSRKTFDSEIRVYAKYAKLLAMPSLLAKEINDLGKSAKKHVLKVCSLLSKYLDMKYNTEEFSKTFQRIRKLLGLKWYVRSELPRLSLEDPVKIVSSIILSIKSTKHRIFCIFMLATGLRTSEALDAWENFSNYYKSIDGVHLLEIMKERKTKRAYFAFITPKLAETIKSLHAFKTFRRIDDAWVWKSWREAANSAGYDHRTYPLYYLRKVNATLLRRVFDKELVDLLQGRAPKSILDKYYNVESLKYLYSKYMESVGKFIDTLLEG